MSRRHYVAAAAIALGTAVLGAGCDDNEQKPPQVMFESHMEAGLTNCTTLGTWFSVGNFGNPNTSPPEPSQPVPDGSNEQQGSATVTCAVTPNGADAFDVAATVQLTGTSGGAFTIRGTMKTTGDQTPVFASFSQVKSGIVYLQNECTVRYTTPFQGIAAGRVWGEVTCPNAQNQQAQTACQAVAQFRFENCSQ